MDQLHQNDICLICFLPECPRNPSKKVKINPSHVDNNKYDEFLTGDIRSSDLKKGESDLHNNNNNNNNNGKSPNSQVKQPHHHHDHGSPAAEPDRDVAENIAQVLKIIGDNLDATANDCLSHDIVLALRNIGDTLDTKIGSNNKSFIMAALGSSGINIGQILLKVARPQSFLGTVICTSLQLALRYRRL